MEILDLYKFVHDNDIEYHCTHADDSEIILFVNNYLLDEWSKILGTGILDEEGIECVMKEGYFCFEMKEICDHFGIDIKKVFDFEKQF